MNAHDFLLKTPQPSAWSTETKNEPRHVPTISRQDVKRNLLNMDVSTESLGILSLDDMKPTKDSMTAIHNSSLLQSNSMEERRRVLESTRALLEKYANRKNHTFSESTVNESDLHDPSNMIMTPTKGSTVNESDLLEKSITNSNRQSMHREGQSSLASSMTSDSFSAYINDIRTKFEANSTATLSDIIENQTRQSLEFDSGMFQSAEIMKDQLEEDEKQWKQQYLPIPSDTQISFCSQANNTDQFDEKISMGEFFRQKSDNCSLFHAPSPSDRKPISLMNSTAIDDITEHEKLSKLDDSVLSAINQSIASVLSISDIQNMIKLEENTPKKVIQNLIKAPLSNRKSDKSNSNQSIPLQESPMNGNISLDKTNSQPVLLKDGYYNARASLGSPSINTTSKFSRYASSSDVRTSPKNAMASSTKLYSTKSLNSITDNKENLCSPGSVDEKNRTLTSCRSTSSMESIPEGMTKLASTKNELVWGCVKEGRGIQQDVTIRNKNNRRVKYMILSSNINFKLNNIELQGDRAIILLHPLETRQLFITCSPKTIGHQTGNLFFTPIVRKEEQVSNRQHIGMYAYGGHVNIQIKGQTRDLTGKLWVSLGCLDGRQELCTDFVIRNSGTIDGFVCLTVNSKSLCAYDDISLTPSKVVIRRGCETNIRVCFRPSKNDLQLLNQALVNKSMKASEIAMIRMISGADINRQRINKMNKKLPKEHNCIMQDPLIQQLSAPYQNSQRSEEIRYFNESSKSVKSMMQTLESTEISLLVDRDIDATLMPDADDSSVFFKTMICPDDSSLIDLLSDQSYLKSFNVEPSKIILTPPTKCNDYLLLSSNYNKPVGFRISVNPGGPLTVSPSSGDVRPGEIFKVKIECDFKVTMARQDFDVVFNIEDEELKVMVSVLNI